MFQDEIILREWIEIFVNSTSSDQAESSYANDAIHETVNSDGEFIMSICSQILELEPQEEENIIQSQCVASKLLLDMLTVQNQDDIDFNRSDLNEEIIDVIKNTLRNAIISDNTAILGNIQKAYAYLFATLTTEWQDGIDDIVNSFTSANLFPNGIICLISTMREIVHLFNFATDIFQPFQNQFTHALEFSVDILSKEQIDDSATPELRTNCCNYIHELIDVVPSVITEDQIQEILEIISHSFDVYDKDLHESLKFLLITFVKQFYNQSQEFFDKIYEYISDGIDLVPMYPECGNSCICFWGKIAELEYSIIEKCSMDEKIGTKRSIMKPLSPLLTETYVDELLPIFIEIIKSIDEEDTNVEDLSAPLQPSMHAVNAIKSFYNLMPEYIFSYIVQQLTQEKEYEIDEKWTDKHSIILMIYTIIENQINEEVGIFISEYFDYIISCSEPTNVPRLRETAIFVLAVILINYPQVVSQIDPEKRMNQIIQLIHFSCEIDDQTIRNLSADDLKIISRFTMIIFYLSSICEENIYRSHYSDYFDELFNCIEMIFNIGIMHNNSELILNVSESLNNLIQNSCTDNYQKIYQIYGQTLDFLVSTMTNYFNVLPEVNQNMQSSFLSILSTILLQFRRNKMQDQINILEFAPATIEIVYELMSNQVNDIDVEGLLVISSIINAAGCEKSVELFSKEAFNILITEFINNALNSFVPKMIESACILIGSIYYNLSNRIPELSQIIPEIFDTLSSLILYHKELRESFPSILGAISDIFIYTNFTKSHPPDLEKQYGELIMKIMDQSKELDLTNEKDVDFGNQFYESLLNALTGYAKVYLDKFDLDYQREQLFIFDKLSAYIWEMCPKINDSLSESFRETAKQFAQDCARRNSVIINRHSIHRILRFCYKNTRNSYLKKSIKETSDFMKTR